MEVVVKFFRSERRAVGRAVSAGVALTMVALVSVSVNLGVPSVAVASPNDADMVAAERSRDAIGQRLAYTSNPEDQPALVEIDPLDATVTPGSTIGWKATLEPSEGSTIFFLPGVSEETITSTANTSDPATLVARALPWSVNDDAPMTSAFGGTFVVSEAKLSASGKDISSTGALLCTDAEDPTSDNPKNGTPEIEWTTDCGSGTTAIRVEGSTDAITRELDIELLPVDNAVGDIYVLSANPSDGELTQSDVTVSDDAQVLTDGSDGEHLTDEDAGDAQSGDEASVVLEDEPESDASVAPMAGGGVARGLSSPDVTKTPAKVECPGQTAGIGTFTCDVTWDVSIKNGDNESLNGKFVDSTSQEVYDVQAKIKTGGAGGGALEVISTGYDHSLAIDSNGRVWAWGNNDHGQLGRGSIGSSEYAPGLPGQGYWTPVQVTGLSNVVQVSAGTYHSLAVTASGAVYAWGDNSLGQLGLGPNKTGNYATPQRVVGGAQGGPYLSDIKQVSGYESYSIAVTNSGDVYSWGSNQYGVLGNGQVGSGGSGGAITHYQQVSPIRVRGIGGSGYLSGIAQVSAGYGHVLALTDGGTVLSWGNDAKGQLGRGSKLSPQGYPGKVVNLTGIKQVSAGMYHSVALNSSGGVYTWGMGQWGQLGNGASAAGNTDRATPGLISIANVVQISAGAYFTLAVTSDNSVYGWGANQFGQVGNGSTAESVVYPTKSSMKATQVAAAKGTMRQWGLGVSATDKKVYGWGNSYWGQLGRGYAYDATGKWVFPAPAAVKGTFTVNTNGGSSSGGGCPSSDWKPLQLGSSETNSSDPTDYSKFFEERTYLSSGGTAQDGNGYLDIAGGCEVQIQISGKVDRGTEGFVIGNQAWYESTEYPRTSPDMSKKLPLYDSSKPWIYGKWTGNNSCTGDEDACDQVYAQIEGFEQGGSHIAGTVWDASDGDLVPPSDGSKGVQGVKVRLTGTTSGSPAKTVDLQLFTDAKGNYSFGTAGGNYTVTVTKPTAYESFVSPPATTCPDGGKSCVDANGQVSGLTITSADRTKDDVNAGLLRGDKSSMTVQKGWWDGSAVYDSVIVYEDSWTETVTVKAENTGDNTIENLTFTDKRDYGADVAWGTCSVDGTSKSKDLAGVKRPNKAALGFDLAKGETMTCTGTLEMVSNNGVDVEHKDTVTIEGSDDISESASFVLVLKPSEDKLDATKGIRTGANTINSNAQIDPGETEDIKVRIINNSGEALSNPTMTDETLDGPDVENWDCPAKINGGSTAQLDSAETVWCNGELTMNSATRHQNAVIVTGINANGDVLKDRAVFTATSVLPEYPEGSLPRAGMLGIRGYMIIGFAMALGAFGAILYIGRSNRPTPRH